MKITPYNSSKIPKAIVIAFILISIGTLFVLGREADPEPSESIGGKYVIINNNTKYKIQISNFVMRNPHHSLGKSNVLDKLIPAKTTGILGPSDNCSTGNISWSYNCFWGEKGKTDRFSVTSEDFPDKNKILTIEISKGIGIEHTIQLESQASRNKNGYCTYPVLIWEAKWNQDQKVMEITFTHKDLSTGRVQGLCKE